MIWFIGSTYTLSAPRSDGRPRGYPPAALVGVGLVPTAFGALQWCTGMIKSFASVAGLTPDEKLAIVSRALDAGRAELTQYARASMVAIPILAVIAVVIVVSDRNRDAAPAPPQPHAPPLRLAAAAAALVLAALLVLDARPMTAENAMPWPSTMDPGSHFRGRRRRPISSDPTQPSARR